MSSLEDVFFKNVGYFYQDVFGAKETLFLENMSLVISGIMSPLFNFCFISDNIEKKDFEVLEKTWRGPMTIIIDKEKDFNYQKHFYHLGFKKYTSFPILYKKIEEKDFVWARKEISNVEDLEVKLINNDDKLKDFCSVVSKTFSINEKIILGSMKKNILTNKRSNFYVGYFDKIPVATVASLNNKDKAFIWNMAIVPEYRKLKFMKKIGYRMIEDNFNSGVFDTYTFTTVEETAGLFQKMGAKKIGEVHLWIRK
jgi:hypothetical protein